MEIWKDIEGYEGLFQVSNEGRVRRARDGKIKRTSLSGFQYPFSRLTKDGEGKSFLISHLVANAFIKNDNNCRYIVHKDGDITNNRVSNLYWSKTNESLCRKVSKPVVVSRLDGSFVGEYRSMSIAAFELGVNISEISRCCIGDKRKSSHGYVFKFLNK